MQRLLYNKTEQGTFVNKTPLMLNGYLLYVVLDGLQYKISSSNNIIIAHGNAKNNVDLKKTVKESLKRLGVQFLDELRTKKAK